MESKSYRTTSDVIVIYEANDTEGRREREGRCCSRSSRKPEEAKARYGREGGHHRKEGRKEEEREESREEKVHKFGDSIFP